MKKAINRHFVLGILPKIENQYSVNRRSEIEGAFFLFKGRAFDRVGVDHGGAHVAVAQQFLDRADVIVGLQQMAGK